MSETEKKKGTVVFMPYATGSKSESMRPCLYENRENVTPLHKEGDNPFENSLLQKYDGQQVEITGSKKDDRFIVTDITIPNLEGDNND